MPQDLKCPSCRSDNTQRLSIMYSQQSVKGTIGAGRTMLAASLKKPQKPWPMTVGFLVALVSIPIFNLIFGSGSAAVGFGFIGVWFAVGYWMKVSYQKELQRWEDMLEQKFMCLRCGKTFYPPTEAYENQPVTTAETSEPRRFSIADEQARAAEREQISNKRIGYAAIIVLGVIGFIGFSLFLAKEDKGEQIGVGAVAQVAEPALITEGPPNGFRHVKWGAAPSAALKKYSGPTRDGITMYVPTAGKTLLPIFDVPVAEELYSFQNGRFFSGNVWFDGRANFEKIKVALFKTYGQPSFTNEKIDLWKWKWKGDKIEVHLSYQPKFSRTTLTYLNDSI